MPALPASGKARKPAESTMKRKWDMLTEMVGGDDAAANMLRASKSRRLSLQPKSKGPRHRLPRRRPRTKSVEDAEGIYCIIN